MKLSSDHLERQVARELGIEFTNTLAVTIDGDRLRKMADHLRAKRDELQVRHLSWDDPLYWLPDYTAENRSLFFAVGNAINFRFWTRDFSVLRRARGSHNGQQFEGSMYMWRSLRLGVDKQAYPLLDARFWASITRHEFDAIFADDSGNNPLGVAATERITNLRDLGSRLCSKWQGQFLNVARASGGSLVEFARLSHEFRAFDDPFYKLTMVNAIMHQGSRLVVFDASPIPAIDYELMKQLLRQGILRPNRQIRSKLAAQMLLTREEVIDLRRASLDALLQVSDIAGIPSDLLDNVYWGNRRACDEGAPVCSRGAGALCPFLDACEQQIDLMFPLEETRYY